MNSNTLEHLKLIIAHLDKLLEQASKRTPGEWVNVAVNVRSGYKNRDLTAVCAMTHKDMEDRANAAFIASCAGNAEAGWRATKAAIRHIISGGRGYENGEELLTDSILAAWPLELLETKP